MTYYFLQIAFTALLLIGTLYALYIWITDSHKRRQKQLKKRVADYRANIKRANPLPSREAETAYIESDLDFSRFSGEDWDNETATERQIEHLKHQYNLDIPANMPKWTASNLITCLRYTEAIIEKQIGHRAYNKQLLIKTLQWVLGDDDMARHIKRLNQSRFQSGSDFTRSNLPTTSKYYKRLENFLKANL